MDYSGVAKNLLEALRIFAAEDFEGDEGDDAAGALREARLEIAKLDPQLQRLMFRDPDDVERCVQELADPELRDRFNAELARFARTVNTVLPDPTAKPYLPDLKRFMVIKKTATQRYRIDSGEFDPGAYGAKIRTLIDEHIASLGIDEQLPPIRMTAPGFAAKVEAMTGGPRAKASEMENAIRHHISIHGDGDPTRYQMLSERLDKILTELKDDWDQQALALKDLMTEIVQEERENPFGLSEIEARLYRTMTAELATSAEALMDVQFADATRAVYLKAAQTIHRQDFWRKRVDQEELRLDIFNLLHDRALGAYEQLDQLATSLFDVIRSNRRLIPRV